ncbi:hypothetical protein VitviT2T_011488 [Vitis vinifera]|uniref:Cytochrome P450 71D10 n=1 Tax=Vitis vinifera TaxID=29760 RepID=A0ABY9CCQ2_VITVI|nr:hypothetical protein VitviT2T_011488 [Vitis vinifera]
MKTDDVSFAQRPNILVTSIVSYGSTNIGFAPYSDYWRQVRKLCATELLSAKRVKSFQLIREEEVSNVIKRIASHSGSTINLSEEISSVTSKLEKLHERVDRILQNIVKEHKESMTTKRGKLEAEDLVDTFLKIQEDGDLKFPLTENNVKAVILSDGKGTRVRREFAGKGTVEESGIHELKFIKAVVKETLRLHPPAPLLLPREYPDSWTEPERFNPERFLDSWLDYKGTDFEFIPFGAGRRMCPDMSFAIPSVELSLANFIYHFDWKLPTGIKPEDLDMTEIISLSVRRKQNLHLIPIPYNPFPAE